ncbi:MAG: hypothetical protein ABSF41_12325 [Pseudolabrys sp.]|jgi:hypothetical protein
MLLTTAGLVPLALTAFVVWRAANRPWHLIPIVALALVFLPVTATFLTGEVSRYLPRAMFSDGAVGTDQVVLASVAASILVASILAACAWSAALWRRIRVG